MNWKVIYTCSLLLLFHYCIGQNSLKAVAANTRTSSLHKKQIAGEGMTIYIYEPGQPLLLHEQFEKRATQSGSFMDLSLTARNHSTHIGGIIFGGGVRNLPQGMAYKAFGHFRPAEHDLADATDPAFKDMLVSNHSYLDNMTAIPDDLFWGLYDYTAKDFDAAMYSRPYWLPVVSAGNSGLIPNKDAMEPGYDQLYCGLITAKNSLTVANAESVERDPFEYEFSKGSLHPTSSAGPTDDFRIKPDITGFGTDIEAPGGSTSTTYIRLTGTSMASANVSGTLLLLQEYYKKHTNKYMRASTLKGLALHTASLMHTTPNQVGPDARSGWGLLDAKLAADVIEGNSATSIIEEHNLSAQQPFKRTIKADGTRPLQVSICWTDPPGKIPENPLNSPAAVLINDLDLRVYRKKGGGEFKPYALRSAAVTTVSDNNRDPYERVDVMAFIIPGEEFEIVVTHKGTLFNGSQDFSLIVTWVTGEESCKEAVAISVPVVRSQNFIGGQITNSSEITGSVTQVNQAAQQIVFIPGAHIHDLKSFHAFIDNCFETSFSPADPVMSLPVTKEPIIPGSFSLSEKFLLHPNPANDYFFIRSHLKIRHISIYGLNGILVKNVNREPEFQIRLDISDLAIGMYLVVVTNADGSMVTCKLIKE